MSQIIRLDLTLEEPTAITDGSAEAAGHRSLDWIPGTSILGSIVPVLGIKPTDDDFRRVFLSTEVRFLDAVPAVGGVRTRARPLSIAFPKRSNEAPIDRAAAPAPEGSYDRARVGFMLEDPTASLGPDRIIRDHVGIDPATRTAAQGVLFAYEAMAAGTTLVSYVLCEDSTLASLMVKKLNAAGRLRIGRSRQGGYGRVNLVASLVSGTPETESTATDRPTRLVLASDYCPGLGQAAFPGLESELSSHGIRVMKAWCDTRVVRGFRGIWGLPRPPIEVLRRGSVLLVETDKPVANTVRDFGLGRRRNEGFGRIAFDPPIEGQVTGTIGSGTTAPSRAVMSNQAFAHTSTELLGERAARRIAANIAERALQSADTDRLVEGLCRSRRIRSSQLSNLRTAIADHRVREQPGRVTKWFEGVCEKSRGDAWAKTIVPSIDRSKGIREIRMTDLVTDFIASDRQPWQQATEIICGLAGNGEDASRFNTPARRHRVASLFIDGLVHRIGRARRREEQEQ